MMSSTLRNIILSTSLILIISLPYVELKNANDIPRQNSKTSKDATTCGLPEFTKALADCTEPLKAGVPDHRGNWTSTSTGHWELIEQCGDRYAVSGPGSNSLYYIHDFPHVDGTLENGVNDYNGKTLPECNQVIATGNFENNCMNMKTPTGDLAASRCLNSNGTLTFYNQMLGNQVLEKVKDDDDHTTSGFFLKGVSVVSMILGMVYFI